MQYRLVTITPATERAGVEDGYVLEYGETTVGRRAGADIVMPHPAVSGLHARITIDDRFCTITDLGSSNGTSVNGERIQKTTTLASGDRIVLGQLVFAFEVEASESPALAVAAAPAVESNVAEVAERAPEPLPEPPPPPAPVERAPAAERAPASGRHTGEHPVGATIQQRIELMPAAVVDDEQLARIEAAPAEVRFPSPEQTAEPGVRRIARRRIEMAQPAAEAARDATAEQRTRVFPKPPNRRTKVPTVLQMEAVECGAAALAMILATHGRCAARGAARRSAASRATAARRATWSRPRASYGLVAKGFKHEQVEDLYQLELPVILFWNFNHFVVLEGFGDGKA